MSNDWIFAQWNDLARFVRPRDQAISALLDPPLLVRLKDTGPHAVAEHIYERLSQRGIHYTWEHRSWGKKQAIRTPAEILETHQGTCLDLALLFASCLEAQFVHPIVVILDGHALVAFWKADYAEKLPPIPRKTRSSEPAVLAAATMRNLLTHHQIVAVECTGFALFDRPVTLDPTSERTLRTRKFPLDDHPALPQAPVGLASHEPKLIAYPGATSLGTTQLQNATIQYGVCIATARDWEILPMTERDARSPRRGWEGKTLMPPGLPNGESPSSPRPSTTSRRKVRAPHSEQHIVGRQEEMRVLDDVITGQLPSVVNIYGPGGIGKTVVCDKFAQECSKQGIPYATVTWSETGHPLTIGQMLSQFRDGLEPQVRSAVPGAFDEFAQQCRDHETIDELRARSGGLDNIFDRAGKPRRKQLKALLETVEEGRERFESYWAYRWKLQDYINRVDGDLTDSFLESVIRVVADGRTNVVLLVDTYEMLEGVDGWMCETFVKALPPAVKVILLGRDRLNKPNSHWRQYTPAMLQYYQLPPLSKEDTKDFLRYHGLLDEQSLEDVYTFTQGYPLGLVLAVEAIKEQGWKEVRGLTARDKDQVAGQLLKLILRQQAVEEVRDFLEKGVVLEYFDPGLVSCILDVSLERGRTIYDKISTFSFVHPHPQGLQFHEIVREILVAQLKFLDGEVTYKALSEKGETYLRSRVQLRAMAPPHKR